MTIRQAAKRVSCQIPWFETGASYNSFAGRIAAQLPCKEKRNSSGRNLLLQCDHAVRHRRLLIREAQNGGCEIQAVVRLAHPSSRYARSRQHPYGMRRNAEEASVIPARVREAHIEVPVVRRKHMKIALHQVAAPALEAKENGADARRAGNVICHR
jgi:hypothetical protein